MNSTEPTTHGPTNRSFTALEAVALAGTGVALVITRLVLGGPVVERNPVSAYLIDALGWEAVALVGLGAVALSISLCRRLSRDYDRRLGLGLAGAVATISTLNAVNDLYVAAVAGLPRYHPPGAPELVALVATTAVGLLARDELLELARRGVDAAPRRATVATVVLSVLLVVSLAGPMALAPVGTAEATATNTSESGSDGFEDADAEGWSLAGQSGVISNTTYAGNYSHHVKNEKSTWTNGPNVSAIGDNITWLAKPNDKFANHRLGVENSSCSVHMDSYDDTQYDLASTCGGSATISSNEFDGGWIRVKMRLESGTAKIKMWDAGAAEPSSWDGSISISGSFDGSKVYIENRASSKEWDVDGVAVNTELPSEANPVPVAGNVLDQNGAPVENATVITVEYKTGDPSINESDLERLRDLRDNPDPPGWNDQLNKSGYGKAHLNVENADIQQRVALMHTADQWGVDAVANFPVGWQYLGPNSDLDPPKTTIPTEKDVMFSCWEPLGTLEFPDTFEDNIAGMQTVPCDVTVERLDPAGNTQETINRSTQPKVEVTSLSSLGTKEHEAVQMDLGPGFYRVTPEGGQSTIYAVAPNGDVEQLRGQLEAVYDDKVSARTELHEELKAQYDAGNISQQRVQTNESGHYSLEVDGDVVEEVELVAVKGGGSDAPNSVQDVESAYESAVKQNFNDESAVRFENADQETFRSVCERMDSVADETGTPFVGETTTTPPDTAADIHGEHVIPRGVSEEVRMCLGYNLLDDLRNDPLNLLPGYTGDFSDLTDDEILTYARRVVDLLTTNKELENDAEARLGFDLPADSDDLTNVDDAKQILNEGGHVIDSPGGGAGGGETTSPVPGTSPDSPVVDDPDGSSDAAKETISRTWPVSGVDDWSDATVLLRITYSDGSEKVLTTESDYLRVEQNAATEDEVRLEEYPYNSSEAAIAKLSLDVADPDGVGGSDSHARNPNFDGSIPALDAVSLSKTAPGKDENITVGVDPADPTEYGELKTVNVSGPNCDRSLTPSGDEAEFKTCGAGSHRVELTFTNAAGGTQFTEVVAVEAKAASQERAPAIKSGVGAIGRYAVVGNGFESGRIETSEGVSKIELVGILPSGADAPATVTASTTGIDSSSSSTTTVRVVRGPEEHTVNKRIGVVFHTDRVPDDALMYRQGAPIRSPGETTTATVENRVASTMVDTFTSEDGEVSITVSRDPGYIERATHYLGLRFPRLPVGSPPGTIALLPLAGIILAARVVEP